MPSSAPLAQERAATGFPLQSCGLAHEKRAEKRDDEQPGRDEVDGDADACSELADGEPDRDQASYLDYARGRVDGEKAPERIARGSDREVHEAA